MPPLQLFDYLSFENTAFAKAGNKKRSMIPLMVVHIYIIRNIFSGQSPPEPLRERFEDFFLEKRRLPEDVGVNQY